MFKKFLTMFFVLLAAAAGAAVKISPVTDLKSPDEVPFRIGGGGGMHFFVEKGKLEIDFFAARVAAVRVILYSPDREILADAWLPPVRKFTASKITISADDLPVGLYAMAVFSPQDQYGERYQWGFAADCPKYVIESARGHKDARHLEPIVLASPQRKGKVCFPVCKGAFKSELSKCVPGSAVRMLDQTGKTVAESRVDAEGKAAFSFPADPRRTGLWALEFDRFQGMIEQDELTRWAKTKGWEDASEACHWTDDPGSWFQFGIVRKALRPFYKEVNIDRDCDLEYTMFNYDSGSMTVTVASEAGFLKPEKRSVYLPPKTAVKLKVRCAAPAPGSEAVGRVRFSARGISSFVTVKAVNKPADDGKLTMPFVVKPYRNGDDYRAVTGAPDCERYFDNAGREYCNDWFFVYARENGKWRKAVMADGSAFPRPLSSKLGFDKENRVYLVARRGAQIGLLWSSDGAKSFHFVPVPVPATFADIEVFSGHNHPNYPPPVTVFNRTSGRTKESFWRQTNHMSLLLPEIRDGKVVFGKAILLTKLGIGIAVHSGMPQSVISVGDRVHVIWGEATDPKDKSIPGVPTYVATYDRKSAKLSKPVIVGYGPPANDTHNTPSILADGKGYLHAFIGSHGDRFRYTRSLEPNSSAKWRPERKIAERTSMTYVGALCGKDDTLYLFYREWPRFQPYGYCAVLALRTKKAEDETWSDYRVIARSPFTDYSVYYHKVSIGPDGKLYVSWQYFSTYWFFRNDFQTERMTICSPDGAESWYQAK